MSQDDSLGDWRWPKTCDNYILECQRCHTTQCRYTSWDATAAFVASGIPVQMLLQYWVANFVALESVVMGLGSGCGDEDDTPVACLLCNRCVDKFLCLLSLLD